MTRPLTLAGLFVCALSLQACVVDERYLTEGPQTPLPKTEMVAAAHPLAAEAGLQILREGGTAVDAAIAVQAVLGLVEPQSSGIGGGAFMLFYDPATKDMRAYDGRETAPASATPTMFVQPNGEKMPFVQAWLGGRSVGVPGAVAMLEMAHKKHGKLPWPHLFDRAIELAETGFPVSPRLAQTIATLPTVAKMPDTKAYFIGDDGVPAKDGEIIKNPEYAKTLRLIAEKGAKGLLEGEVAKEIIAAAAKAPNNPTKITRKDLASYEPKEREPVCGPYRGWRICSMPPPSSGGIAVLQILALLQRFEQGQLKPQALSTVHLVSEASRLAYADRDMYVADPDVIPVPVKAILDPAYLAERSKLIDPEHAMGIATAGELPKPQAWLYAPDVDSVEHGTSHFSIIDSSGRAVAMTTTVESAFGSHLMAGGFFLNNQLTDFSFLPVEGGKPVANAVAPGKRPRSSMAPVLAFDPSGKFRIIVGSPGGPNIIAYVAQTLVSLIDGGATMQQAVAFPHHVNRNGATELEQGTTIVTLGPQLKAMGHEVALKAHDSGLHGILITDQGLEGGADPRRDGAAVGD